MITFVTILLLSALALRIAYEYLIRDRGIPPGPPRLPLIGNLHQAPTGAQLPWHVYASWAKQYGPIFSVQFGGETLIMLANDTITHDLLNKRGKNYSHRPRFVMASECMQKGMHIMLRNYDDDFKRHQRMEAAVLTPRASEMYVPLQDLESKQLLHDLINDDGFTHHFERLALSFMYALTYGFRLPTANDPNLAEMRVLGNQLLDVSTMGRWIVDTFPFLNRLPDPLTPWKKIAERYFQRESSFYLKNMKTGINGGAWDWTKEFMQSNEGKDMDTVEMAYDLGILSTAGWETTAGVLHVFTLASAAHPGAFESAQAELDEVVGKDRLPTLEDRPRLRRVEAAMKEAFRWRTILPCAFPHRNETEDWYAGYRIPAKSIIIPLQWCMNLDEDKFSNPNEFDPTRWLTPNTEDLKYHAFGYGRRICPGRYIAENTIFLNMARLLWAYNIRPVDGWSYNDLEWDTQFFTRPLNFKATFHVRSPAHQAVIEREWKNADVDVDKMLNEIEHQRKRL